MLKSKVQNPTLLLKKTALILGFLVAALVVYKFSSNRPTHKIAQAPSAPEWKRIFAPESCTVIFAGRLFAADSAKLVVPAYIHIKNGRVVAVDGHRTNDLSEEKCPYIDLGAYVVLPGLFDVHTHLLLTDRSYSVNFRSELIKTTLESEDARMATGRKYAGQLLSAGFTTIRDMGNAGRDLDLRLREEIALGKTRGPKMLVSGQAITHAEARFAPETQESIISHEYRLLLSAQQAESVILGLHRQGVNWISFYSGDGPSPLGVDQDDLRAMIAMAHASGEKFAVDTSSEQNALVATLAGADSIERAPLISRETLNYMAVSGTFLVPLDLSAKLREIVTRHGGKPPAFSAGRLRLAKVLGVPIAFGSDMSLDLEREGMDRGQASKEALYSFVEEGLTPLEALMASTRDAAILLNQPDRGGIIKNMYADLIAVRNNPLEDIRALDQVVFVMQRGEIILQH